jgi:hypothetical protein
MERDLSRAALPLVVVIVLAGVEIVRLLFL